VTDRLRAHLRIQGRVQGVGYRYSAFHKADALGLVGWVRNTRDGSVETVVEGAEPAVEDYIDWCRRGPSMARVTDIHVDRGAPTGEFARFDIRF